MNADISGKKEKGGHVRQRFFVVKELQLTVAAIVVIAMLGAVILHSGSTAVMHAYGFKTPLLGLFLIVGYIAIVVFLVFIFTGRLLGAFKRLEHEMRLIKVGERHLRLSVRAMDDIYVRNFVGSVNSFLDGCESRVKVNSSALGEISTRIDEILSGISVSKRKDPSMEIERLREELKGLKRIVEGPDGA